MGSGGAVQTRRLDHRFSRTSKRGSGSGGGALGKRCRNAPDIAPFQQHFVERSPLPPCADSLRTALGSDIEVLRTPRFGSFGFVPTRGVSFDAEVWEHDGSASWFFVSLPEHQADNSFMAGVDFQSVSQSMSDILKHCPRVAVSLLA